VTELASSSDRVRVIAGGGGGVEFQVTVPQPAASITGCEDESRWTMYTAASAAAAAAMLSATPVDSGAAPSAVGAGGPAFRTRSDASKGARVAESIRNRGVQLVGAIAHRDRVPGASRGPGQRVARRRNGLRGSNRVRACGPEMLQVTEPAPSPVRTEAESTTVRSPTRQPAPCRGSPVCWSRVTK